MFVKLLQIMNSRELSNKFDDLTKLIHESFKITAKEPLEINEINDEVKDIYEISFLCLIAYKNK